MTREAVSCDGREETRRRWTAPLHSVPCFFIFQGAVTWIYVSNSRIKVSFCSSIQASSAHNEQSGFFPASSILLRGTERVLGKRLSNVSFFGVTLEPLDGLHAKKTFDASKCWATVNRDDALEDVTRSRHHCERLT